MPDNVRVVLHHREIQALAASPEMRDELLDAAGPVVSRARAGAPKDTGEGAASIRADAVMDDAVNEWTVRISWTRQRYYMIFHDGGTKHLAARRFLEEALEGALR